MPSPKDYGDLRLIDLVAKKSHVNLREVEKTLRALRDVMDVFGMEDIEDAMVDVPDDEYICMPSPDNSAACAHAFSELFAADCN